MTTPTPLVRRALMGLLLSVLAAASHAVAAVADGSIAEMQLSMETGKTTAEKLVREFNSRIKRMDRAGPRLNSIIAINPEALQQARALDAERRRGHLRGPLHGIPVLLKDNIESADNLATTAGSLALRDNITHRDAPIVANLRAAGAIILGKANLSEWANFRSDRSISGWSAMGGLTRNPHALDRSACGSSSGSAAAVAAGFAVASLGTETDGSIVCPASMNGVVALKPTHGLLSAERIVPIAHSQDTAGPMARSVADLAAVLTALVGKPSVDYSTSLQGATLVGKRIGILRFPPGRAPQAGPLYEQALTHLKAAGATLVEVAIAESEALGAAEMTVLTSEFKTDLEAYLAAAAPEVKARTLVQLVEFNRNEPRETALFGQEVFERSAKASGRDEAAYGKALETSRRLAGDEGIGRALRDHRLDFLVSPTTTPAWRIDVVNGDSYGSIFSALPAVSGYPHLTVPMGTVNHLPVGLSFVGAPWSEAQLLAAASVFEQHSGPRPLPKFLPSVESVDPRLE